MTPTDFESGLRGPIGLEELKRKLDDGQLLAFESRTSPKGWNDLPGRGGGAQAFLGGPAAASQWLWGREKTIPIEKRAEEALRESEQRWRCLTEAAAAAGLDRQAGWFVRLTSALSGRSTPAFPQSELRGWNWLQTLHPDDREPNAAGVVESSADAGHV